MSASWRSVTFWLHALTMAWYSSPTSLMFSVLLSLLICCVRCVFRNGNDDCSNRYRRRIDSLLTCTSKAAIMLEWRGRKGPAYWCIPFLICILLTERRIAVITRTITLAT
eukprot:1221054-Amphidinium_carterae.1